MVKSLLALFAAALLGLPAGVALAQGSPTSLAGTYNGGQMEVAAGLRLLRNGRFEYGLSYGAVDEEATGRWSAAKDGIVLDSDPVNEPAFELVSSETGPAEGFDLTLETPDRLPVELFEGAVLFGDKDGRGEPFDAARHHFELKPGETVTAVALLFSVYEIAQKFAAPPDKHAMTFRFHPNDLGHVAFKHQLLKREGNAFVLERFDRTLRFRKER